MKKCPYCAEEIQDEAILCRYCGKSLIPGKTTMSALVVAGGLHSILGVLQFLSFAALIYGAIGSDFQIFMAGADWFALFTFARLLLIGIVALIARGQEQTKSSLWSPSLLFGLGIASLLVAYNIAMGNRSMSDLILRSLTNVLFYTFLSALVGWIWRKSWGKYALIGLVIVLVLGGLAFQDRLSSSPVPMARAVYTASPTAKPTATFYPTAKPTATFYPTSKPTTKRAPTGSLLQLPEQSTNNSSSEFFDDVEILDYIISHARHLAITSPYQWQIFNLTSSTRYQDIYDYYYSRLSISGYKISFNDQGNNGVYLLKFINGKKRVTVEFWEADSQNPPAALVFYEGW